MEGSRTVFEHGSAKLYIDGKKTVPVIFHLSDFPGAAANTHYAYRNIRNFAEQGVNLVGVDTELRLGWHKRSRFEWEPLQAEITSALAANPNAKVLIRLHVNPPYWWLRDNPDETVIYDEDTPGVDNGETLRLIRDDHWKQLRGSIASEKWLEEAGSCLAEFCRRVCDTPEGRAVFAINVAYGINGEWHQWGVDCSRPMKRRFRRYLLEKYRDNRRLREAWGDPGVTIDTAEFRPNPAQAADDGVFRDPVRARCVMDAQECLQIAAPEAIIRLCRVVKENWSRPILTGAFYAYYYQALSPISGHLMPQMLYDSPYVDFLGAPAPYMCNRRPDCVPMQRGLLESNRIRGMLWLTEMDEQPVDTENYVGGDPKRLNETIAQLRRNTLYPLLAGHGFWYYDHRCDDQDHVTGNPNCASIFNKNGWWDHPALLDEIRGVQELAARHCLGEYRPAADVLIVSDTDAVFAVREYGGIDEAYAVQEAIARTGAAFDNIYLKDLEYADMDRYRVVVFVNAYVLNACMRERIRLLCAGRQIVWLYAAGFSDGRSLSLENMEETTGIRVKRVSPRAGYHVCGTEAVFEIRQKRLEPCFAVDDGEAEPLAVYPDGEIAAARKGDSWYFALPRLDLMNMKKVVQRAGAHVYCSADEPVLAGNGIVALNCTSGGRREIALRNGKRIVCDLPRYTTACFDAQTGERLDRPLEK